MRIEFKNLSKNFGSVCAVDRVSGRIDDGELFFLLGPSGCGKTTLLRMIAGLEMPDAGSIEFDGDDVTRQPPHRRNTAMVFQGYALWPHMTVKENVAFGLDARNVGRRDRDERVDRALQAVQITELAKRRPNELSGGQQQRVALARTLVVSPGCMLLDEPLANLDAKLRLEMRSEIRRLCKEAGVSTVYVTHDQTEALSMADRIAVMAEGHVLQVGSPRQIYTRPVNRFVAGFVGEANFMDAAVTDKKGAELKIQAAGRTLTAASADTPAGAAVQLCIRPESFFLKPAETGESDGGGNCLNATVVETHYLGDSSQHVVRTDPGELLKVREANAKRQWAAGEKVNVCVAPEDIIVLDED